LSRRRGSLVGDGSVENGVSGGGDAGFGAVEEGERVGGDDEILSSFELGDQIGRGRGV
jgi:hypothetical protein